MSDLSVLLPLAALAGAISLVWGMGEIVGAFKNETPRALRSAGAWLLLIVNFLVAGLVFVVIASLIPQANTWLTAILTGLAWPTVIRNTTIKLAQPMQVDPMRDAAVIRFEQTYANVQNLARQLINSALTRQRMKLVVRATKSDLQALERFARLTLIASPLQGEQGMPPDQFIDAIMQRQADDEIKKALLAAFILANFGREALDDFLNDRPRASRAASTKPRSP